eukprot:CAMPEP_0201588324 /NCGR_PEP_ID=MMETSP0190_2-20130828/153793_1 /ASSEMBLY_ACC=CAM_ASM_000263 /TAXON_ID=37353 /ORGANISM="Rosalina sp." /LENGTH=215 /DNA_ID=CAMNT_0048040261 /DNA_START=57 /DNA_END=704 /DNA_ORIENTATION=-
MGSSGSGISSSTGEYHQKGSFNDQIDNLIDNGSVPARRKRKKYTFYTKVDKQFHQSVLIAFEDDSYTTNTFKIELCKSRGTGTYRLNCSDVRRGGVDSNWDKKRSVTTTMADIKQSANDIIGSFGTYDMLSNNCQHFAVRFLKKLDAIHCFACTKVTKAKLAAGGVAVGIATIGSVIAAPVAVPAAITVGATTVPTTGIAAAGYGLFSIGASYKD